MRLITSTKSQELGWTILCFALWLVLTSADAVRPLFERAGIVGPAE